MKNEKAMSTLRRVGVSLIACFPFFGHANSVLSEKELRAQCSSLHFSQVHVRACLEEKSKSERTRFETGRTECYQRARAVG